MSAWEFHVALQGYMDAHSPDEANSMSAAEQDEIWRWLQEKDGLVH